MNRLKYLLSSLLLACAALPAAALSDSIPMTFNIGDKVAITPRGRFLMDGGLFISPEKGMFRDGVALTDVRLGVKGTYGKWSALIEAGFAYDKVGLKDVYLDYNFNDRSLLRAGSYINPFGLQSAYSSSLKPTLEEPTVQNVFGNNRQIGLMYLYYGKRFWAGVSLHAEHQAISLTPNQLNTQGYGLMTRLVWHKITPSGCIWQVGISGAYASPHSNQDVKDEDGKARHDFYRLKANFPTQVNKVTALDAELPSSRMLWKFSPEILLSWNRLALESQYYYLTVSRKDGLRHYQAQGAYVALRGLILGNGYSYNYLDGAIAIPGKGSLEFVAEYDNATLSDTRAGVYGGRINSISGTMTYHFNRYILARLRYSYSHRWDAAGLPDTDFSGFQARVQVIF